MAFFLYGQESWDIVQATETKRRVTLLCGEEGGCPLLHTRSAFLSIGYKVDVCQFLQKPPPDQDIVSVLDLEAPFFTNITTKTLGLFLEYVVLLQTMKTGILWLTKSSQIKSQDPNYSQIIGMARTIRSELGVDFATLEIDSIKQDVWMSVCKVFKKFQGRTKDEEVDSDSEFAISDGIVYISRFHWISVSKELAQSPSQDMAKRLDIEKKGQLSTLQWVGVSENTLEIGEVELECRAVGMNFRDVLVAMNIVQDTLQHGGMGCECAGIVQRVGAGCETLSVGDRVMAFTAGSLSTRLTAKEKLCAKIPGNLSFEDAATMPCVYSTVIYSLLNLGRLEEGQTVLIHSAAGGVGIAAIQVCQWIGATIFLTAGNEEKAEYLCHTFGIPRNRIFNSRDASFLPGLMAETNGIGADVVLNSLSGELLHASFMCVAEHGKMLEIGKRDFIGRAKLNMQPFLANRSFFGIDLAAIGVERPDVAQKLLGKTLRLFDQGAIKPISPIKIFEAEQIEDAFRYMQKGSHMGKIVIRMPAEDEELVAVPQRRRIRFRPDVSYLLVGGLGGLGQAVSTWMAEHGAKNLVYLSRTAGQTERDRNFSKEIESYGCKVQMFPGNVSVLADVEHVVRNVTKPIAGVMQMSMVLRDRAFAQISIEDWETVISPKVQGTWNLHKALATQNLDFLVLFSSIAGLCGQWGQANYAAANTFLDSFVQFRHSMGLAASVLDLGAMVDVGYISENKAVYDNFRKSAVHGLHERELLESLQLLIDRSARSQLSSSVGTFTNYSQIGIGVRSTMPIEHPENSIIWKRDPRMAVYRNLGGSSEAIISSTSNSLIDFVGRAKINASILDDPKSIEFLAREIGLRIFRFLMRPEDELDIKISLKAVGLDSLVAIEMRNWWRQSLGLDVTVLEILAASSIEKLGELAAGRMKAKYFS